VGLLHKGNNNQIQFAYELYLSTTSKQQRSDQEQPSRTRKGQNAETTKKQDDLCTRFKETLSRENVRVHFVGAWDTVSSIGLFRGPSLPETTTGMKHVCFFRHGLALDEKRGKFLPELANGGDGPLTGKDIAVSDMYVPDIQLLCFALGGGNVPNPEANHFGPALRWMKYEAMTNGLRVSPQKDQWEPLELNLSVGWFYKAIDQWPYSRLSYRDRDSTVWWPPHRGAARQVKPGQKIHQSVFESMGINTESVASAQSTQGTGYRPLARLPDGYTWGNHQALLEPDPYLSAVTTIAQLQEVAAAEKKSLSTAHREVLEGLVLSVSLATAPNAGRVLFETLELSQNDVISCRVLATAIMAVGPDGHIEYSGPLLRDLVSMIARTPATKLYKDFIKMLCRGHQGAVNSVAFSPDSKRIASGSKDSTIRIWDVKTGETVGVPFTGHKSWVRSVAFSPNGAHIVSGSDDDTIRIWDSLTGETVAGPFTGHKSSVLSVAFSPDGTHVVSGSLDETIRIWDAQTGKTVAGPFTDHKSIVMSVAFSPDGTRVVSGSCDMSIRIWNAQTGETVAGPFSGYVRSVAFSPDGMRVVSGSYDQTIRTWDAQTGQTVAGPFTGQTYRSSYSSVAFSPGGKCVVSGSDDRTIRIWDAQTGKTVAGPLRGHTEEIWSVAYSPDGKLVASGSEDHTVRIWDAEVVDEDLWH
ncbi:WD40 repeat-like protein, partial [Auriscalpium vulgare]